ncbi:putative WD repeat-containing protein 49 [Scophthalmus maximus]|uniref:Putative WD repeat-containing protein 49 n=1 Tax=Scophthalmus maximus TaxID=52904 RepID=A0A2U9B5L4_SCOMX|nr:putative WD repeat-containing protein 49 [Scophthalmus maximus]
MSNRRSALTEKEPRSYDGEIIVWNNGTEKALRRLQPRAEQEDDRTQQDLVSCGGSGVVRLWNTFRSRPVGQFAAHNRDLGSIVMTVSPCGKYLVTADREGTLKTWDIQRVRIVHDLLHNPH